MRPCFFCITQPAATPLRLASTLPCVPRFLFPDIQAVFRDDNADMHGLASNFSRLFRTSDTADVLISRLFWKCLSPAITSQWQPRTASGLTSCSTLVTLVARHGLWLYNRLPGRCPSRRFPCTSTLMYLSLYHVAPSHLYRAHSTILSVLLTPHSSD